ncbi:MAG: tetratricopeptide repeat protein, partial [Cyclobacteriaceae bacterium]
MLKICLLKVLLVTLLLQFSGYVTSEKQTWAKVFYTTDTLLIKVDLDSAINYANRKDIKADSALQKIYLASLESNFGFGETESLKWLARYYRDTKQDTKAFLYYDSAFSAFSKYDDWIKAAECSHEKGVIKLLNGDYPGATECFAKALEINTELDYKPGIANNYSNLGIVLENSGNYAKALEYYFMCLEIDEDLGNKLEVANDYNSIAIIFGKTGKLDKAIEYYNKALDYFIETNNKSLQASTFVNLGIALKHGGRLEEAEATYKKALDIFLESGGDRQLAIVYHNLGSLATDQNKLDDALKHFNISIEHSNEANTKAINKFNYAGIAKAYLAKQEISQAKKFAFLAIELAEETESLQELSDFSFLLHEIFKESGDYKNALMHHEKHLFFKDSLFNVSKAKQISELQVQYETEKAEQEIESLSRENELQEARLYNKTIMQYALLGALIASILLALVVFRNHRIKQISKRLLLAEQLKVEQLEAARLKEMDELKTRFFANISHEFRTPLTLILGPIEKLISESESNVVKDQLAMAKNNGLRMVRLVNELLDLSKLEAGAVKLNYHRDNVVRFIQICTFAFQSFAEQNDVELKFSSQFESLETDFDKDKLEKILSNLLSNAIKFTLAGGFVQVSIIPDQQPDFIRIKVSDTGTGIPSEDLPYVFDRFYQAANTGARIIQGTGIGLQLARELVELQGGTISVANQEQGGAEFSFTLPVVQTGVAMSNDEVLTPISTNNLTPAEYQIHVQTNDKTPAFDDMDIQSELVLVVEDNPEVRQFIVATLQDKYRVIEATNGDEGVIMALETIPDIIISDVMMPGKSGYEVCQILKEDQKTSHIPIIMLTGKADMESKIEGLELGADDYLVKPFNTRELLVRVANLTLQRKKL